MNFGVLFGERKRRKNCMNQEAAAACLSIVDSDVTASDLESNCTFWHKSCHLKFNNTKLARVMKKRASQENEFPMRPSKHKPPTVSTVHINSSTPASADRNYLCGQLDFLSFSSVLELSKLFGI